MSFLAQGKLFDTFAAYFCVVELQKQSFAHAHCNLDLDEAWKHEAQSSGIAVWVISAEIPPESNAYCKKLLLKHKSHNLCGQINMSTSCKGAGACKKGYPEPFRADKGHSSNHYYIACCRSFRQDERVLRGK